MNEITAVGFDFDNTLILSEKFKVEIIAEVFEKYYGIKRGVKPLYRSLLGKANREQKIKRMIKELVKKEPTKTEIKKISNAFGKLYKQRLTLCPVVGCVDVIKEIKKFAKPLFLISLENKKEVVAVAEHCGIAKYFDVILGGPDSKRKNFLKLIKKYKLDPSKTLYIGDSKTDIITARKVGFKRVGIQKNFTSQRVMDKLGAYETYCNLCEFSHDLFAHFKFKRSK